MEDELRLKNDPQYAFCRKHAEPVGSRLAVVGIACGLGLMLFLMYYSCKYYLSNILVLTVSVLVFGKIIRFILFKVFVKSDCSGFKDLRLARPFFMFRCYVSGFAFGVGISFVFFLFWKALATSEQFVTLNCNF